MVGLFRFVLLTSVTRGERTDGGCREGIMGSGFYLEGAGVIDAAGIPQWTEICTCSTRLGKDGSSDVSELAGLTLLVCALLEFVFVGEIIFTPRCMIHCTTPLAIRCKKQLDSMLFQFSGG